jgi:pimeloyl-ACP methyl ester carboxylesterase
MPRTLGRFCILLSLLAVMLWSPAAAVSQEAPAPQSDDTETAPQLADPLAGTPIQSVYVRLPVGGTTSHPLQVLLALHGMGGTGDGFAQPLIGAADQYGWLIVAPTIAYGDWTDPNVLANEDPTLISALSDYLDQLPANVGVATRHRVLILGHSRGAQLAHRFAEFRPDKVLAVASMSAGDYTLPTGTRQGFPFGVNDLASYTGHSFDAAGFASVPFLVGVGGRDTNPGDIPRQWDGIEGTTRVQRAEAFEAAMQQLGAHSVLRVFGGAQHDLTSEMRQAACDFLGSQSASATALGN